MKRFKGAPESTVLTHVGQSAAGLPIQLADRNTAIRVTRSHVSFSSLDEIHGDRTSTDRFETFHHVQNRVATTQT